MAQTEQQRLEAALREKAAAEEALREVGARVDSVVQGLTAALYALELEDVDAVRGHLSRTLEAARAIIIDLAGSSDGPIAPGDLVRRTDPDPPARHDL